MHIFTEACGEEIIVQSDLSLERIDTLYCTFGYHTNVIHNISVPYKYSGE